MLITSLSEALSGSEAVLDVGNAVLSGALFIPYSAWPTQVLVSTSTAIGVAAALEYVNNGLASPTSSYDGIDTGSALTSATMTGAFLLDPVAGFQMPIFVRPYAVQMKTNIKVHVYGASGTAQISVLK